MHQLNLENLRDNPVFGIGRENLVWLITIEFSHLHRCYAVRTPASSYETYVFIVPGFVHINNMIRTKSNVKWKYASYRLAFRSIAFCFTSFFDPCFCKGGDNSV
jgi:hypothetical protein